MVSALANVARFRAGWIEYIAPLIATRALESYVFLKKHFHAWKEGTLTQPSTSLPDRHKRKPSKPPWRIGRMVQILHPCSSSTNSRDTSHIVPNSLRSSSVMGNEGLPSQSDCPCQSTFHRHEQYETALNPTNYTMTGNKGRNWCFLQRKKRITGKKKKK